MTLFGLSVATGFISAAMWLLSAVFSFWTGGSYYGGPPPRIRRLETASKFLNAGGALFAAFSIWAQAYATYKGS